MVTQKDVAKKAGVSSMTVSRVINNQPNVKEETRRKVLKAIKELGYYPNTLARGLNTNKLFSIGIVIPFTSHLFSTPYYVELLTGIEKACAEYNYEMVFLPKKDEISPVDYCKLYYERKADGLLIIAPAINDEQIKKIEENKIPCVLIDGRFKGKNILFVDGDNVKGGFLATEYLIKKGHKKIGFISGWWFVRNTQDRLKGYKKALKKYSIKILPEYIVKGDFSEEAGYNGMNYLLNLKEKPTAVFCANDLMAIGAIKAVNQKGLKVPDDISIIGFDNIKLTEYYEPAITTIKQFAKEKGYKAVQLLLGLINNKKNLKSEIFDVELIERDSVKNF